MNRPLEQPPVADIEANLIRMGFKVIHLDLSNVHHAESAKDLMEKSEPQMAIICHNSPVAGQYAVLVSPSAAVQWDQWSHSIKDKEQL